MASFKKSRWQVSESHFWSAIFTREIVINDFDDRVGCVPTI